MLGDQYSPIPVTLLGGFLGAGKTTLLNHALNKDHGARIAVLVNDFGTINIDAKLVVGVEGETVTLANGCVCCTIRNDLVNACLGLLRRPKKPDHVLIELSGVTDPWPVLSTFLETDLSRIFTLNSLLTVVDAQGFPGITGDIAQLARMQIQAADILVLNKVDLVNLDELAALKPQLHEMAPRSRILEVTKGQVPLELIFTGGSDAHPLTHHVVVKNRGGRSQDQGRSHISAFATWSWSSEYPLSLPSLRVALEQLPEGIYRCKGVVLLEELPSYRYVLQMVGKRYHFDESGSWGNETPRTEIVLIGGREALDSDKLQTAFDACIGTGDESQSPILRLVRKLSLQ